MKKDELVDLLAKHVPEYLDYNRQTRGFFAGVCDGRQTQLMIGGDNAQQILGALFGIVCQFAQRTNSTPEEVLSLLSEILEEENKKLN